MGAQPGLPGEPGYELRRLSVGGNGYRPAQINTEFAIGPAALSSLTLVNIPAGNSGVVEKFRITGNCDLMQEGWLEFSYDGGVTYPFSCDMGVLWGSRPVSASAITSVEPVRASCDHMFTQQFNDRVSTLSMLVENGMSYPIPFKDGLIIRLKNPTAVSYVSQGIYFEAQVTYCQPSNVWPYQLRSSSANMNTAGLASVNNFTFATGGFTLNSPNVAMNGENAGSPVALATTDIGQLARVTGPGWVVGLAFCAQTQTNGNVTHLERNFGWYLDGATAPVLGGAITTTTHGQPSGPGIGSPTMYTTGTEDTFDAAFYDFAHATNAVPHPGYSQRTSMGTANGTSDRGYHYSAFLDVLSSAAGYRYETSMELWLLTETRVTTGSNVGWSVLYYADMS